MRTIEGAVLIFIFVKIGHRFAVLILRLASLARSKIRE
jgi:hypothetical protein